MDPTSVRQRQLTEERRRLPGRLDGLPEHHAARQPAAPAVRTS